MLGGPTHGRIVDHSVNVCVYLGRGRVLMGCVCVWGGYLDECVNARLQSSGSELIVCSRGVSWLQ